MAILVICVNIGCYLPYPFPSNFIELGTRISRSWFLCIQIIALYSRNYCNYSSCIWPPIPSITLNTESSKNKLLYWNNFNFCLSVFGTFFIQVHSTIFDEQRNLQRRMISKVFLSFTYFAISYISFLLLNTAGTGSTVHECKGLGSQSY